MPMRCEEQAAGQCRAVGQGPRYHNTHSTLSDLPSVVCGSGACVEGEVSVIAHRLPGQAKRSEAGAGPWKPWRHATQRAGTNTHPGLRPHLHEQPSWEEIKGEEHAQVSREGCPAGWWRGDPLLTGHSSRGAGVRDDICLLYCPALPCLLSQGTSGFQEASAEDRRPRTRAVGIRILSSAHHRTSASSHVLTEAPAPTHEHRLSVVPCRTAPALGHQHHPSSYCPSSLGHGSASSCC